MAREPGPDDRMEVAPEAHEAASPSADRSDGQADSSEQLLAAGHKPEPFSVDDALTRPVAADEIRGDASPETVPGPAGIEKPLEAASEVPRPEPFDDFRPAPEDWRSATVTDAQRDVVTAPTASLAMPTNAGPAGLADDPLRPRGSSSERPAPDLAPSGAAGATTRRGGVGSLLLGGMVAAILGFGAALLAQDRLGLLGTRPPADLEDRLAALEARPEPDEAALQSLVDRLGEAEARLSALEAAPAVPAVDVEPLRAELTQELDAAQARLAELEERLASLEAQPDAPTGDAAPLGSLATREAAPATPALDTDALRDEVTAALEPRLSAIEATLSEARAALADLDVRLDAAEATSAAAAEQARAASEVGAQIEARAAAAEAEARARAALGSLDAALDSGEPIGPALAELEAIGTQVPDVLAARAAEGVPTLATLRETFPDAARAGLAVARDQGLLEDGGGVLGFLRGQLSVRSTAPRQGEDPDAVLSRAEGHLAQGRVGQAVADVESLPEPVRDAMADWIAQARARADAEGSLAAIRNALPAPQTSNATTAAN